MRRAPLVLAGTAAGLTGVLMFHPHGSTLSLGTIPSASGTPTSQGGTAGSTGTSATPGTSATGASSGSSGSSSTGSANGSSGSSSENSSSSGSTASVTYTGTRVSYDYGVLSVRVTVSGRTITSVGIASLTDGGSSHSQSIDQQSIPVLEKQALAAQGADIQGVSGASYTSEAFARSLQSALSKSGL